MTYGLLIYDYAHLYSASYDENGVEITPALFDSVSDTPRFFPNHMIGWNTGKNSQKTPNWGSKGVVATVTAKAEEWTQEMTDAINNSAAAWNEANPLNRTDSMKLIFTEEERSEIDQQIRDRQVQIVTEFMQNQGS
jgi:hypothetical protein